MSVQCFSICKSCRAAPKVLLNGGGYIPPLALKGAVHASKSKLHCMYNNLKGKSANVLELTLFISRVKGLQ